MKHINQYITEFLVKDKSKINVESKKTGSVKSLGDVEVGDILTTTFSYSSRHVYFWQVEKLIGKSTVEVRQIDSKIVSGSYNGQGKVMPNMEAISNKTVKSRISKGSLKIDNLYAYFWNGEPQDVWSD